MTKVDIFSGFLGAGKTTLIKKLIADGYNGAKLVLIENEFGQIGIDGGFLKESGIEITEMNSGCICCSLVGDFGTALKEVIDKFSPDRILIEPSGVGKLSDVVAAVKRVEGTEICGTVTVIDASKCRIYLKNFKEFYENQIKYAGTIILSRTGNIAQDKLDQAIALIREINDHSQIITTPWDDLSGVQILKAIEEPLTAADMAAALLEAEQHELEHAHHHHEHGEDCDCEECRHHHHDHDDDDDDDDEHEHEHGHHHHHHHHHEEGEAEEYGIGTFVYQNVKPFDKEKFENFIFNAWPKEVIRAKGLFWVTEAPNTAYIFEQSGKQKYATDDGDWIAAFPEQERKEILAMNPDIAAAWHPVYGDRVNKLVFIGRKMNKAAIIKALDDCIADEAK